MAQNTREMLAATGFSVAQTERYLLLEQRGEVDACVLMLRCHRSELVDALHEAQRPIDVLDWAIHDLERATKGQPAC